MTNVNEIEKQSHYSKYKDRLQEYYKQKVTCDCGDVITYASMYRHKKGTKHMLRMVAQKKSSFDDYVICECGGMYSLCDKDNHLNSAKHIKWNK
jgi:arabinogalactan endo-1,4-beta-galactosidase